jgi:signal transduction histidine kinase
VPTGGICDEGRTHSATSEYTQALRHRARGFPAAHLMISTRFGGLIAERMRAEHRALAARWFERLLHLLPVDARDIFPTESLLDHIPALILEIGAYLQHPEEDAIASNTAIIQKAQELGGLRHAQQASLHQLLREYQVLSGILVAFVLEEMQQPGVTPSPAESAMVVSKLHQAVNVLSQSTVESFVSLYTRTIAEQNERLEQFTRMAAHEWRQPLSALHTGTTLLGQEGLDPARARRTIEVLQRNVTHLIDLTHKLEAVARIEPTHDNAVVQEVDVSTIVEEAARQLREMAEARGVEIRVSNGLPWLTVDVGRLELVFVNLLSNAIKYCDPAKPVRYVEVTGQEKDGDRRLIVVRDNGLGIPQEALASIFRRFTRGHPQRDEISGLGLGLSIVEDCVRTLGGTVHVESTEGVGSSFALTLPVTPPRPAA